MALPQVSMEPCFSHAPFSLSRLGRYTQNLGGLLDREPIEEAQLNDSLLAPIELHQPLQGFVYF
jgi:hypothetical protein